ncbi:hypothetical protein BD779DRAFT_1483622 [Infundibulicybe gibba]|nr:hypothetical protein BD779DRAFT_1483622 [Infundibulicybe gibba]
MAWSESFSCPTPDFRVRSAQDGTIFAVQRAALQNSEVFRVLPTPWIRKNTY